MTLHSLELRKELMFLNIYSPNSDRISFGKLVMAKTCFKECNIILGGDLNFFVGMSKNWGLNGCLDLLFIFLLENDGM